RCDLFAQRGGDWAWSAGAVSRGLAGVGDRIVAGRDNGLRDQSGARFWSEVGARDFAGRGKRRIRLGLCNGADSWPAGWGIAGGVAASDPGCFVRIHARTTEKCVVQKSPPSVCFKRRGPSSFRKIASSLQPASYRDGLKSADLLRLSNLLFAASARL